MKESTEDQLRGKANEAIGTVKEKVGKATDDPELEGEGQGQKVGGKVEKKVGDIKKVFNG
jgi:uncharacterized protein YjbJ (UPF0337 family)